MSAMETGITEILVPCGYPRYAQLWKC